MNEAPFPNESAAGLSPEPAATYTEPEGPAKRAVLASIGAVATACDLANETYGRFVHRGSQAQEHFLRRADDVRMQNAGSRARMGEAVRSAMNAVLDGLNVPNKADVDVINAKLNIVNRKLDDLHARSTGPATPPAPPVPPAPDVIVPADESQGSVGL